MKTCGYDVPDHGAALKAILEMYSDWKLGCKEFIGEMIGPFARGLYH